MPTIDDLGVLDDLDFLGDLGSFVVRAKAATYVGNGRHLLPSRPGSVDLQHHEGRFAYHDCYFGGAEFLGQEVVYHEGCAVWGMNYYGYLLDSRAEADTIGRVIKAALAALYREGRFLGGWRFQVDHLTYVDENTGAVDRFHGVEHMMHLVCAYTSCATTAA